MAVKKIKPYWMVVAVFDTSGNKQVLLLEADGEEELMRQVDGIDAHRLDYLADYLLAIPRDMRKDTVVSYL